MGHAVVKAVDIFHSIAGRFYTARNPVQFWSRWNPRRVKGSVALYRQARRHTGAWVKLPFTVFIFSFWGFTDDIVWFLVSLMLGFAIFPFGFWTVSMSIQSLVVIAWKRLPRWLPRLPGVVAIPATHIYMLGSLFLVQKYIF